ncbi:MAG: PP2C family protein-serine/threonine phosphatase [Terracidiphilus sp.]
MNSTNPLRTAPRRAVVVFLLAVFFTFVAMGIASDIVAIGRIPTLRFGITVVLSGSFAVCYAIAGVTLRSRVWKAFIPLFAVQIATMSFLAHKYPNKPQPRQMNAADVESVESRLNFDGNATIIAVCLGYAGFVHVFVSESRRHIKASAEKAVLEAEMAAAREIQQVIVPEKGEAFPGFTVDSVYQPARQVGGDFFQVLPASKEGLLVVVGDVAGKGLPAAMLVSMLVGSIRTTAEDSDDPVRMLRKLHDRLVGRTMGGFATALAAHITRDGLVTIANAGHLSPYLDGKEVELAGALPLGIAEGGKFEPKQFYLQPGSRLTFYSDGVVEAQNKKGELFGFERAGAISTQPAAAIVAAAVEFGQEDDITVVTIERLASHDFSLRTEPLPAPA